MEEKVIDFVPDTHKFSEANSIYTTLLKMDELLIFSIMILDMHIV